METAVVYSYFTGRIFLPAQVCYIYLDLQKLLHKKKTKNCADLQIDDRLVV